MAARHFKLPDPGEGLTEAEIVTWKVKVGDVVKVNDIIIEIETAKSLVELPVPYAGTVTALLVSEGQTVAVGTPIISVDDGLDSGSDGDLNSGSDGYPGPAGESDGSTSVGKVLEDIPIETGSINGSSGASTGGRVPVLVGYGARVTETRRRPRKAVGTPPSTLSPAGGKALAKPPVRKLARDLGIDLPQVAGSGEGGIVTRADVEAQAAGNRRNRGEPGVADNGTGSASFVAQVFARNAEREVRIPVKGVLKVTAQAMVDSAFTAPHVTEFITVDVTRMMRLVDRLRTDPEFRDVHVSPMLVVAKALIIASRRHPGINATWDEGAQEIVVKNYVNLGIAAATPRGLMVPNIKDADQMSLRQLAEAMAHLVSTAREGRTQPDELVGGSITITNVGVFGVDAGTPILNVGEAAILCFGAVRQMPWVVKGKIKARWVTQLCLSFDHRLVNGDLGSGFLADLAAILHDPGQALVWA